MNQNGAFETRQIRLFYEALRGKRLDQAGRPSRACCDWVLGIDVQQAVQLTLLRLFRKGSNLRRQIPMRGSLKRPQPLRRWRFHVVALLP